MNLRLGHHQSCPMRVQPVPRILMLRTTLTSIEIGGQICNLSCASVKGSYLLWAAITQLLTLFSSTLVQLAALRIALCRLQLAYWHALAVRAQRSTYSELHGKLLAAQVVCCAQFSRLLPCSLFSDPWILAAVKLSDDLKRTPAARGKQGYLGENLQSDSVRQTCSQDMQVT